MNTINGKPNPKMTLHFPPNQTSISRSNPLMLGWWYPMDAVLPGCCMVTTDAVEVLRLEIAWSTRNQRNGLEQSSLVEVTLLMGENL